MDRRDPGANGAVNPPQDSLLAEIEIVNLEPDPFQPRTIFTEGKIQELAESLRQHGVLQPLLVRPMQGPNGQGRFWIVAGERRYRAAQLLGWKTLPCRIRLYENMAAAVVALAENIHREDLSEIDKAQSLLRIKTLTDRTWEEVAELVKLSRDYVKRLAGLLKLEESVQALVRSGEISVRTAIALRPLPARRQVEMAKRVVAEGLTAEEVRAEVSTRARNPRSAAPANSGGKPAPGPAAPVVGTLRQFAADVRQAGEWVGEREWSPSRVTDSQARALEELYQAVSLLQQQLIAIRRPLKEPETTAAERLRRADVPF